MTKQQKFRNSYAWKKLRAEVRTRDGDECVICKLHNEHTKDPLAVHHIISIYEDWNLRMEKSNLITLCDYHHVATHNGKYNTADLLELVKNKGRLE